MSADDLTWFKSSYSSDSGDSCVEVATAPDAVRVRDSKLESSPLLSVTPAGWAGFVAYAADA
ncbi:DUF397 domain-containing protein [Streptomyces genisteinicus]|uniref:DUF397 domain-containing protein n=1 Tax=Streptomyces genisteinicus TaxID=2768068 RepID=A0A7H0HWE0_9ACTN|nr:DUF397 domain-containing protein [Streptomyces genisteinicus]QNP64856.1 DUF397 domain-containing protein [Streptomyces genisteinicus]